MNSNIIKRILTITTIGILMQCSTSAQEPRITVGGVLPGETSIQDLLEKKLVRGPILSVNGTSTPMALYCQKTDPWFIVVTVGNGDVVETVLGKKLEVASRGTNVIISSGDPVSALVDYLGPPDLLTSGLATWNKGSYSELSLDVDLLDSRIVRFAVYKPNPVSKPLWGLIGEPQQPQRQ